MEFTSCLIDAGWVQGVACPTIFVNVNMNITAVCHGDNVHALGQGTKVRATLGFEPKDDRFARFLNKHVRLTEDGLQLEADPRHATEIISVMSLDNGTSVSSPINDLQCNAKRATRDTHASSERERAIMKRMARYLRECPRLITTFVRQHQPCRIRFCTDNDFAGCRKTRKSKSSINILHDMQYIKTVSSTQPTIALSSPDSEYYALTKGCSLAMGIQSMFRDTQIERVSVRHNDEDWEWHVASARDPFATAKRYMRELWRFPRFQGRTTQQR